MSKWIILDRDGVINYDSNDYIKSPNEWLPIPGSLEAIAKLNQAGYQVVVITNQSGISRGLYDEATLARIHDKMQQALKKCGGQLAGVFYCPHTPEDNCFCRKPKTGLFKIAANTFKIALTNVFAIGDKLSDIQAARAAGCKPILVLTGKGAHTYASRDNEEHLLEVPVLTDLAEAVAFITTNN